MELRHIRYFMAVAEELNFTRAAEKLCIAQPPLSRQIKDLEEELGAELFERRPRSLRLTEAGQHFKQYAEQILNLVDRSSEEIHDLNRGLQGTLYLASVEGQGPHLISSWIAGFHKLYPEVQFSIWNGNSDDVALRVRRGLCDMAVIVEPYDQEGFTGIQVYEEPWIAMIPPEHPLAKEEGDTIDVRKLDGCDLIVPSRTSRLQEIRDWFAEAGAEPKIIGRMAHVLNAYELTEQGVGISIYPAAAATYAAHTGIRSKILINPSVTARYALICSSERPLTLVAREFLSYVESCVKGKE